MLFCKSTIVPDEVFTILEKKRTMENTVCSAYLVNANACATNWLPRSNIWTVIV